jgi:hypothetical protein
MPLSQPVPRKPVHRRRIDCHGYLREDGLWDIEAYLCDTKSHELMTVERGLVSPGEPIHVMWFRLTVDDTLQIHDAEARTDVSPFSICPEVNANYKRLVGRRIGPGWNKMVRTELGGREGCTHLTELLAVMATVAIQTIFPYRDMRPESDATSRERLHPSLPDSCHGFRRDGPVIARYWPNEVEQHSGKD